VKLLSKRKREKMKSKEKRHGKDKPFEAVGSIRPTERKAVESGSELFSHLKDASPDWQQFYKAVSKAME
jgi:hypothetical protein